MGKVLKQFLKIFLDELLNTIQYTTIQCNTMQYNTIQYSAMQCNAIQYNSVAFPRKVTLRFPSFSFLPIRLRLEEIVVKKSYDHKFYVTIHGAQAHSRIPRRQKYKDLYPGDIVVSLIKYQIVNKQPFKCSYLIK